jgi:hypothetical protein
MPNHRKMLTSKQSSNIQNLQLPICKQKKLKNIDLLADLLVTFSFPLSTTTFTFEDMGN